MVSPIEIFSYGFIQRALLAGVLIAVLCSVLGVFLLLRRFSLIGDGLAHATFGSAALALAFKLSSAASLVVTLPLVMLSSLGILRLTEKTRLSGDAAIGIVSSLGIAAAVILASVGGGFNVDLLSYLFGNILAVSTEEVWIAVVLFVVVSLMVWLFFYDLCAIAFNEELATVSGISARWINRILVMLTALSVVLAMRLVGIMLISSLLILPAASALQVARSFKTCMLFSSVQGALSVVLGIYVSFATNLPTSATIVLFNMLLFAVSSLLRRPLLSRMARDMRTV